MKFLATIIVFVAITAIASALISFIRFAFIHIKAYLIRRRLSKSKEQENKDD